MAGVEYDHSFEIRIIGDSGVGKSSLICTFDGEDNNVEKILFGDYAKYNETTKVLKIDGKRVQLLIRDKPYGYSNNANIFMYDIANKGSFINLTQAIENMQREFASKRMAMPKTLILGNKFDSAEEHRAVDIRDVEQFASKRGARYLECSVRDDTKIKDVLYEIAREVLVEDLKRRECGSGGSQGQYKWEPVSKVHHGKYVKLLNHLQDPELSRNIKKINGVRVCFEEQFMIGSGADGTSVYIGLSEDGYERAVKRLLKNISGKLGLQEKNILNTLNAVDSKCIVRYWFYDEESDPVFAYLILDLCEETLEHYVEDQSQEKLAEIAPVVIRQLLEALNDLHRNPQSVLHRDLKPSNILRNVNDKWLLADFGLSRTLSDGGTTHRSAESGTKFWRAVESYPLEGTDDANDNKGRFKRESDIQVAGLVAFHILTKGKHAFGPERRRLDNLLGGNPVGLTSLTDPVAKDLISWMLQHKPENRPYAQQALKHPYLLPPDQQFELLKCVGNEPEIKDTKTSSDVAMKINADPLLPKSGWISSIDSNLVQHVCRRHTYPDQWAQCLRFIRNTSIHWNDNGKPPIAVQNAVGDPQEYFLKLFPTLPAVVHRIIRNDRDWKEKGTLKKFF